MVSVHGITEQVKNCSPFFRMFGVRVRMLGRLATPNIVMLRAFFAEHPY